MNKRLRKKKHRGEFKEIGFDFKVCFTPIFDYEKHFEMINDIYWLIEQHGFAAGGGCDESSCDGHMATLSWRINADEMKNKLRSALLNLSGVTSVEFCENTDAWYGPFSDSDKGIKIRKDKINDQLKKISLKELFDRCVTTPGYGDNVLTMDWSDEPQGKEFYECCKLKTGVTERTLREHCQWLAEISNIVPLDIEKSRILSKYSVFHSSFIVQSHRKGIKKPLANCIMQLIRQDLIGLYNVILTILVPIDAPDEEITHKEIANIHQVIRDGTKGDNCYIMGISKGRTNRIKSGVMLVLTQFVYDRPPWCEEKMRDIAL